MRPKRGSASRASLLSYPRAPAPLSTRETTSPCTISTASSNGEFGGVSDKRETQSTDAAPAWMLRQLSMRPLQQGLLKETVLMHRLHHLSHSANRHLPKPVLAGQVGQLSGDFEGENGSLEIRAQKRRMKMNWSPSLGLNKAWGAPCL